MEQRNTRVHPYTLGLPEGGGGQDKPFLPPLRCKIGHEEVRWKGERNTVSNCWYCRAVKPKGGYMTHVRPNKLS